MNKPTADAAASSWPRLRFSFVAMTAALSVWVHGSPAWNDNAGTRSTDPGARRRLRRGDSEA